MALSMFASIPDLITHARLPMISKSSSCKVKFMTANNSTREEIIVQRTSNYQPTIWDYDYVKSLRSDYVVGLS